MGLIDLFRKNEKSTESKSNVDNKEKLLTPNMANDLDLPPGFKPVANIIGDLGMGANYKTHEFLQEYVSWVYANVTVISEAVSAIKFHLYKVGNDDSVDEVKEHPFLELLYKANPQQTKSEFIFNIQANLLLAGEGPLRLKRNNPNNPSELPSEVWPISPDDLKVFVSRTKDGYEMISKYKLKLRSDGEVKEIDLNPWEIVFLKNINPNNPHRGVGVVEAAATTIDTLHFTERYGLNFFKNSAVPLTVLYTDQKLNTNTINALRESWENNYRGVNNAFKTAILEAGLKVERLQSNASDMQLIEQQKYLRDTLMSMFRTTKVALGLVEDVNRANAEASEYIFMKNCIKPKMQKICDYLNEFVLPIFDKTGTMFLDFDDPVPENRELEVKEYSAAINNWMTPNEVRAKEGLPDLEGGDVIYQPFGLAPMGTEPIDPNANATDQQRTYKTLKATIKIPLKDFSEHVIAIKNRNLRYKKMRDEAKILIKKFLRENQTTEVKHRPTIKYYKSVHSKEMVELYIKSLLSTSDKFEANLSRQLAEKFYDAQLKEIKSKLSSKKGVLVMTRESADDYMFSRSNSIKSGIDLFTPLYEELIKTQGKEALLLLNISKPYEILTEARRFLKKWPTYTSRNITDTSFKEVRSIIADGIGNGDSIDKITKAIETKYETLKKSQAENIARSEVSRATTFATVDGYKQSGVVEAKEWVVTEDDRLCEFCLAMEQTYNAQIPLDENYFKLGDTVNGVDGGTQVIDYTNVDGPPLHPRCRCVTIPVLKPVKAIASSSNEDAVLEEIHKIMTGGDND